MLVGEIISFIGRALPDFIVGGQSYDFPFNRKNYDLGNSKTFSFQSNPKVREPIWKEYKVFLKQIFEIGSTFYLLDGAGYEKCFDKILGQDIWKIDPTYDWLGEIEGGFDLYLYKFSKEDLKLIDFLDKVEKEHGGFWMMFDIENEVYFSLSYTEIEVVTNTASDLQDYLELLE